VRELPLTQGKFALVDDEDFERLSKQTWHYNSGTCSVPGLSQEVLQVTGMVDHRNGEGLNNQKSNLRLCTFVQNGQNSRKTKNKTSSKYKGVYFCKQKRKWRALIGLTDAFKQSFQKHLGYFLIEKEAARMYDNAARFHHGEFACLNFPEEGERSCL